MASYEFATADVFTQAVFGGNPLAVFPDARGLDTATMQKITREFNLSETAFVFPSSSEVEFGLRIFSPTRELPFAGHPTIGSAHVLVETGRVRMGESGATIVFEETVGKVEVQIEREGDRAGIIHLQTAILPEYGPVPPNRETIARLLSLRVQDLLPEPDLIEAASCGVPFLFVPVRDRDALKRVQLDPLLWNARLKAWYAPHLYVFCHDPELPGSDLRARCFVPLLGIDEDPATGAAVSALAGCLSKRSSHEDGTLTWTVEQGFEVGRPSLLRVEAEKREGQLQAIRVGGRSVLVSRGTMEVPV